MRSYSIAEARNQLSKLVDRALKGESVTITRHGHAVVELKPIQPHPRAVTAVDVDWLDAHRVGKAVPKEDAGALVSRMRDEEWER